MAVSGRAKITPRKPKKIPETKNPNITQRGWICILLDISFGVKKLPSIICPTMKIPMITPIYIIDFPFKKVTIMATAKPIERPMYGTIEAIPVKIPIVNPKSRSAKNRAIP